MRQSLKFLLFLVLAGVLASTNVYAANIIDNYVGADAHGRGDVIGRESSFEIFSADVVLSGTSLTVDIHTNFAGKGHLGLFDYLTEGDKGIGYGDLFLASSWTPYGSAPYPNDNSINGTNWTYAIGLGNDRWNGTGGSATLYSLPNIDNSDLRLSEDFMTGGIYRNGQEVAVGPNATGLSNTASWSINEAAGIISFVADITGTSLLSGDELAFHWGMTCQNDVIEGSAPVPEPATMMLLGTGLLGLAGAGRKKLFKK